MLTSTYSLITIHVDMIWNMFDQINNILYNVTDVYIHMDLIYLNVFDSFNG